MIDAPPNFDWVLVTWHASNASRETFAVVKRQVCFPEAGTRAYISDHLKLCVYLAPFSSYLRLSLQWDFLYISPNSSKLDEFQFGPSCSDLRPRCHSAQFGAWHTFARYRCYGNQTKCVFWKPDPMFLICVLLNVIVYLAPFPRYLRLFCALGFPTQCTHNGGFGPPNSDKLNIWRGIVCHMYSATGDGRGNANDAWNESLMLFRLRVRPGSSRITWVLVHHSELS